jgi:hypothetical protein
MYHDYEGREVEDLVMNNMRRDNEDFTLADIESALQIRMSYLSKMLPEESTTEEWMNCYSVLAQVKQAQALRSIASTLERWDDYGVPVRER